MTTFNIKYIAFVLALVTFGNFGIMKAMENFQPFEEELNAQGERSNDGLYAAIMRGDTNRVAEYIAADVELSQHLESGYTSLLLAIEEDKPAIVKLLLENGADIHFKDAVALETPLHGAIGFERVDMAKWLLSLGADTTIKDKEQKTPLDLIVRHPAMISVFTDVSSEDVRYIILGTIAVRKKYGKDISQLLALHLVQSLVKDRLDQIEQQARNSKKFLKSYPETKRRKLVEESVIKALSRSHAGDLKAKAGEALSKAQ